MTFSQASYRSQSNRRSRFSGKSRGISAFTEPLENRLLMAVLPVTSIANTGTGSLRQAILDANGTPGADVIQFSIGSGAKQIALTSALPAITEALTIDGTTQPGFAGSPLIELRGSSAGAGANGLNITGANSLIKALVINGFSGDGIKISGAAATGNAVEGCSMGTIPAGSAALANIGSGVEISGGAQNNRIGGTAAASRNIISGNIDNGILITGSGTTGNVVLGNYVGVARTGNTALGNSDDGIEISFGASNNTIGGTTPGAGNVVSGNQPNSDGVYIANSGTNGNIVQGNFIGTNAAGTSALPNRYSGVEVAAGAQNNIIGGTVPGARNIIAGNLLDGVLVANLGTSGNIVQGNYIGINATGTPLGNSQGVAMFDHATGNTIGGAVAGAGNVISGNVNDGVWIYDNGTTGNKVQGNLIGTDPTGKFARPNGLQGIEIHNGAATNTIGGTVPEARNIISGNNAAGVFVTGSAGSNNKIQGNYIGTDISGSAAVGNNLSGVEISASGQQVGGTAAGAGNVVSGNHASGVFLTGNIQATVQGNLIGTDATGTLPLGNLLQGIEVSFGVSNSTIGGTSAAARNVISGNAAAGVFITGSAGSNNKIQGNYIGTDITGSKPLGNILSGLEISSSGNTIGGTAAATRNIISGNQASGLLITGFSASSNIVQGNFIGIDVSGMLALGNAQQGIEISFSAGNNTIGGTVAGARNIISGNTADGVFIVQTAGASNKVQGNYIGTDITGTAYLSNILNGVEIASSSQSIGGTVTGAGNVISGNFHSGVFLAGSTATSNSVQGNLIGTDATGALPLGNILQGVEISAGAANNTIGGTTATARNIISGNEKAGVLMAADAGTNNLLRGNYIGTDISGTKPVGNRYSGVEISATSQTIGGTVANAGNLISGNKLEGIFIAVAGAKNNLVQGNLIGTDATGKVALGNEGQGVWIRNASNNTIGGTVAGARNIISGNAASGVFIANSAKSNLIQGNYIGTDITGSAKLGNGLQGVEISGDAATNTVGGTIAAARNVISGNAKTGVFITSTAGLDNKIQGNYIGTNAAGLSNLGNELNGVELSAPNQTLGGTVAGARNLVSGNQASGILLAGSTATGNTIQGNLVGTDVTGTLALGNLLQGVEFQGGAANNLIGGTTAAARNIISANNKAGILFASDAGSANIIQGNFIGTTAGSAALGNLLSGVEIQSAGQQIGGAAPGQGNVISANLNAGVVIVGNQATANTIHGNSIFANGNLGIDLGGDGVSANDADDADIGPNDLQNFPVLTAAAISAGTITITGSLISTPGSTFRIEFFANSAADPSQYGEGEVFIGAANVQCDANGAAAFNLSFVANVAAGQAISATATNTAGSTSEFSQTTIAGVPGSFAALANGVLTITGTDGPDVIMLSNTSGMLIATLGSDTQSFDASAATSIDIHARDGDDTLTLDFAHGSPIPGGGLSFDAGGGNDTIGFFNNVPGRPQAASVSGSLNIIGGNITITSDANGLAITASNNAAVTFATSQHLAALTLADNTKAAMAAAGDHFISTSALSAAPTATLDLADNDLILHSTAGNRSADLAAVTDLIKSGRNGGLWIGQGIVSSASAAEPNKLTGLAAAVNDKGGGSLLYPAFDGEIVDINSILVKYTYNGDADLNGKIDADDYFQIDNGFAQKLTGYRNGDFDFNGTVDADDYFLIDRAFAGQTGVLATGERATLVASNASSVANRRARHHRPHHS